MEGAGAEPQRAFRSTNGWRIPVRSAFVGGFVFSLFGGDGVSGLNLGSIIVAVIGSLILLALYRMIAGGRRSS